MKTAKMLLVIVAVVSAAAVLQGEHPQARGRPVEVGATPSWLHPTNAEYLQAIRVAFSDVNVLSKYAQLELEIDSTTHFTSSVTLINIFGPLRCAATLAHQALLGQEEAPSLAAVKNRCNGILEVDVVQSPSSPGGLTRPHMEIYIGPSIRLPLLTYRRVDVDPHQHGWVYVFRFRPHVPYAGMASLAWRPTSRSVHKKEFDFWGLVTDELLHRAEVKKNKK
jgi:hypothetical protein